MLSFFLSETNLFCNDLNSLTKEKCLINTINAYSFNIAQKNKEFSKALLKSDVLLPDGISVVLAKRFLTDEKLKKIAGADLFNYEMKRMNALGGKCFFLGSSVETLQKIKVKAAFEYPNINVFTFSPAYKEEFSEAENKEMINEINAIKPDVLFIGMTAPKQEKWAYKHFNQLEAGHVCCIGAVFDFYAGTVKRAPSWMIKIGMEWFGRLIKEPQRMWKRYLIGNTIFVFLILKEKIQILKNKKT